MRKLIGIVALAFSLTLALYSPVAAASRTTEAIDLTGGVGYSSILGGNTSGTATLSGTISDGELSMLRGSVNFPLRDEKLSVAPIGAIVLATERLNVGWYKYTCDQFGCTYQQGTSIFERRYGQGQVEIRLGNLRGNGSLSMGTTATCVESCPPSRAGWSVPYGYTQLGGGVTSSQDAGTLNLYGSAPIIH
jgi:hypothetical protein